VAVPAVKKHKMFVAAVAVVFFLILAFAGWTYAVLSFGKALSSPRIFESISPYQTGRALFVTTGLQDRGLVLYIDDFNAENRYVKVGTIYWTSTKAVAAIWSMDGSIIACKNEFGNALYFSYAYDYNNHQLFYPPGISSSSIDSNASKEEWEKHSRKMALLLEERGGESPSIDLNAVYGNGRSPSLWEWARLKKYK
jgi:hypothetical protein